MRQKENSLAVVAIWSVICGWSVLERSLFGQPKKRGFLAALDPLLGTVGPRIGCCHGRIMASAGYHTQESNSTQPKVVLSCLARIPGRVQYSLQHRELAKNTIWSTKATNTSLRESISISSRRPKSYVGPKQIILTGDFLLEPKGRTLPPKRFIVFNL